MANIYHKDLTNEELHDPKAGSSPSFVDVTLTGDLAVNGGDITSTNPLTITSGGLILAGDLSVALGNTASNTGATVDCIAHGLGIGDAVKMPTGAASAFEIFSVIAPGGADYFTTDSVPSNDVTDVTIYKDPDLFDIVNGDGTTQIIVDNSGDTTFNKSVTFGTDVYVNNINNLTGGINLYPGGASDTVNVNGDLTITGIFNVGGGDTIGSNGDYLNLSCSNFTYIGFKLGGVTHSRFYANYDDDQFVWYGDAGVGRQFIIGGVDGDSDYDHAATTDPVLYIHSVTDPGTNNTQWLSLTHNQTDGIIATGLGDITLDPAGNDVILDNANLQIQGTYDLLFKGAGTITHENADAHYLETFNNDATTGWWWSTYLHYKIAGDLIFRLGTNDVRAYKNIRADAGIRIGADSGDNEIDDSTQGSASTTLYIGNETIDTSVVSDRRVKTNISSTKHGLNDLLALDVIDFNFTKEYAEDVTTVHTGLVAQDVEEIYPYAVETLENIKFEEFKMINYKKLIPLLIKSIQELETRVKELEN